MRALLRKVRADLGRHRGQAAAIFAMLAAAAAALTLGLTVARLAAEPFERLMAATGETHLWIEGRPGVELFAIPAASEVDAVAGPYQTVRYVPAAGSGVTDLAFVADGQPGIRLVGMPAALPETGRPLVTAGRWLAEGGRREIVIEHRLAGFMNRTLGDRVRLTTEDGIQTFTIVGLTLHPGFDGPIGFVLPEVVETVEPDPTRRSAVVAVRLTDPEASRSFGAALFDRLPPGSIAGVVDWHDRRDEAIRDTRLVVPLLEIFSLVALLAAGLVIANAIGGRILAQGREIGLLKAVGFTPGQVAAVYLVEHLAIALAAVVAGEAIAVLLAPVFRRDLSTALGTEPVPVFDPWLAFVALLAVEAVVAGFTLLPALRAGRLGTVEAIRVGPGRALTRRSRLAGLGRSLRLPPALTVGLKDAFARPVRAWFTVAALAVTVVTLVFSLGMESTLRDIIAHPERWGDPYDLLVAPPDADRSAVERLLAGDPAVESTFTIRPVEARPDGQAGTIETFAVGGDPALWRYGIAAGRMVAGPGEVVAGAGLLESLGLEVGDRLRLWIGEAPLDLRIVGRLIQPDEGGRVAVYSLESYRQVAGADASPGRIAVNLRQGVDPGALAWEWMQQTGHRIGVEVVDNGATEELIQIRMVLTGLNVVLVGIGLVNLVMTTGLGVRERFRDLGILKVLGLTPRQVMASVVSGVGLLALVAALVGIPAGLVVTRLLYDELGKRIGIGPGLGELPPPGMLLLLIPAAVGLAALGGLGPARFAAGVRVAEVLRAE